MRGQPPSAVRRAKPGSVIYPPARFARPNFHSCALISTRRPRNRTPSASRRSRCSIAESPVSLIWPPAPNTRCQGNPNPRRKAAATRRAAPGNPAARATPPYVETFPGGIARTVCSIRRSITPESFCLVFPGGDPRLFCLTLLFTPKIRTEVGLGAPPFSRFLRKGGDFGSMPLCGKLLAPHTRSCALQTPSTAW
jgi:hypothetical protein